MDALHHIIYPGKNYDAGGYGSTSRTDDSHSNHVEYLNPNAVGIWIFKLFCLPTMGM